MPTDTTERWQNKVNSLKDGIQIIYKTKDFSNVIFRVGSKIFKAHGLIVSARCSEFSKIFMDPNAIDDITIEEQKVTETGFEIFLRFIYTDTLGTDDKQSIVQAYLTADFYNQNKLKEKCEELIESWSISVDEVCKLLNVSLEIIKLKEKCLNFVKNNALDVTSSRTFLDLNSRALVAILENDALKDIEIKQRVMKIIEWGAHKHTEPVNYSLVRDDFLADDPPLLALLGIEDLNLEDLGELFTDAYPGLLEDAETVKFMKYYKKKNKGDLPYWCKKD